MIENNQLDCDEEGGTDKEKAGVIEVAETHSADDTPATTTATTSTPTTTIDSYVGPNASSAVEEQAVGERDENQQGDDGPSPPTEQTSNIEADENDESVDLEEGDYGNVLLRLPADDGNEATGNSGDVSNNNSNGRTVPGVCAICLSRYEVGEQVAWSPNGRCSHAFHTDCIVQWYVLVSSSIRTLDTFASDSFLHRFFLQAIQKGGPGLSSVSPRILSSAFADDDAASTGASQHNATFLGIPVVSLPVHGVFAYDIVLFR